MPDRFSYARRWKWLPFGPNHCSSRDFSIILSVRDDSPYSSAKFRDISAKAWNQVHVTVKDGLAGSPSDIKSDIETIRMILRMKNILAEEAKLIDLFEFAPLKFKITGDMAFGNDQRMSRGNRIAVKKGQSQLTFRHDLLLYWNVAEQTCRLKRRISRTSEFRKQGLLQNLPRLRVLQECKKFRIQ